MTIRSVFQYQVTRTHAHTHTPHTHTHFFKFNGSIGSDFNQESYEIYNYITNYSDYLHGFEGQKYSYVQHYILVT